METHYFLNQKLLTVVAEDRAPLEGQEVWIDGVYYRVLRSIKYVSMCPPWKTMVQLKESEEQTDFGHFV